MIFRKTLFAALVLLLAQGALGDVHQREYGVATTINFNLYDTTTGGLDVDEIDGGTEVSLSCDEGAETTATNDFVDEGNFYSIALTATEMQCARIAVVIAATDTNVVFVETIGNASASIDDDGGWYDAIPYNLAWDADIQSEAADALVAYDAVVPGDLPANFADLAITVTTGRVDVGSVSGTAQTANDNGADINTLVSRVPDIISLANINAQADTALTDYDALILGDLGTATNFGSGATLFGMLNDLADDGTATYSRATDSLQAIRDQGDAAWVTGGGGACTADVGCIADGTAQGVTATTIQLAASETFADNELIGSTVVIASATTGAGQSRLITGYVGSTDTATVDTWTTTPTGTITYRVFGTPPGSATSPAPVNVVEVSFDSTAANNLESAYDGTGYNTGGGSVVAASVTGSVGSVTGAVGSVTGGVGGNVTGSVGSVTGSVASVTGAVGSVTGTVGGIAGTIQTLDALDTAQDTQHSTTQSNIAALNDLSSAQAQTAASNAISVTLEQQAQLDPAILNCEVNTANFAGSTTTLACILTDRDAAAVTQATGDLEGLQLVVLSGAQIREQRFINDTTWDAVNSELQITLSRALPAALADAVTAVIR